jgi:hypothetical protein
MLLCGECYEEGLHMKAHKLSISEALNDGFLYASEYKPFS